ncbi:hypothetical protein K525DRAFT_275210 [Schizophyllum commune Loenen D]|nr:hypothetical protein K525DRAFT_275210 [Schizophyllum commune Loenen D]
MFYLDYPNAISLLSYTLSRRFKSFYKAVIWIGMSARVGSGARVITGDELGLELRPPASSPSPSSMVPPSAASATSAPFLKRVFVLAFEFAFTLKLIPFFFKSNLGLKLKLAFTLKLIPPLSAPSPSPPRPDDPAVIAW